MHFFKRCKLNISKITDALQFLHKKDLLHREITPENVFIRKHNNKIQAAIIDLGVSRVIENNDDEITTNPWIAPEVAEGKCSYGHSADVYGFGLLALYMRTWPNPPLCK